jgi:asparagine synthase (glutamine-hydrolysing)
MCGIAGIVNTERGATIDAATIRRMCAAIIHRGPDEEGIYVKDGVGLGMRRLSIIDLAGGQQPIHNEDKSVWIVFNGEIYNFQELRSQLESRGHRFATNSDTEVIVHLYEDFGADCVRKLRGMFAFALYDERLHKLLLARDQIGIKPLHYAAFDGKLFFGSEIKAILAAAPELAEVDSNNLLQYFYFRYIPDPNSAFTRIQKLPPGHLLEMARGEVKIRPYWDLPKYGTSEPGSEEECLDEMEWRLAEAVRLQLVSDVPLGALLSGGTDSSTVVALMARASSKPVQTFTIGFGTEDFNEAHHARMVSSRFGTEHHELTVEPHFGEALDKLTRTLEEPFGDSSILPTYYVSCMARRHVTVALSGDGGDELFGGYERCLVNLRRGPFERIPQWLGRWYRDWAYARLPRHFYGRNFLFNISLSPRDRYLDYVSVLPARTRERALFSDDFLNLTSASPAPTSLLRDCYDRAPSSDHLSRLLYLETKTTLPADMLTKVDRMSMATSLEVRVPLLDHLFVEWVTRLPGNWKIRGGQGKYILRKLAERVGVPPEVLNRPKQGFAMPLVHWMRQEMKQDLARILLEPRTIQRGYFNARGLKFMLDEHFQGRRDNSGKIWLLLVFELWHRNFLEAQNFSAPTVPVRIPAVRTSARTLEEQAIPVASAGSRGFGS